MEKHLILQYSITPAHIKQGTFIHSLYHLTMLYFGHQCSFIFLPLSVAKFPVSILAL
jgi:hypothetical protein